MRIKIYNFLVNKQPGIKVRYHRMHDNAGKGAKLLSWLYLLWLNFAYYVLRCRFFGKEPEHGIYEEKELLVDNSESAISPKLEEYINQLSGYDTISFDIFDTLIFRPFSDPTDLFYIVGEKLGYIDFKRIRTEAEAKARQIKYAAQKTYEITLEDIWECLSEQTGLDAQKGMQIEIETEISFCYANPFMQKVYRQLVELGKDIIIVSDMYLPSTVLQQLLQENGYHGYKKLYVSCEYLKSKAEGSLYALVQDELQLHGKKVVHVGDNKVSDVKNAAAQGFDTCYYPNINHHSTAYRAYDMSPMVGGAYRGLVNNHLYCGEFKHCMEYEYGYIYGGLFVVGYCNFIHDYAKKNQIDKILFLSRDGDILSQVYKKMFPNEDTEYVYWSRKAAIKLMAPFDRHDFFRRFLEHKVNQSITIKEILSSMEQDMLVEQLPSNLSKDDKLTSSNIGALKTFLKEHWQDVIAVYEPQQEAAKSYYAKVLSNCKKVVAVDIGWAGSGAIALDYLVNRAWNLSCEVIGMLAGTNTVHNAEADASETFIQSGKLVSYMFSLSHNRDLVKKHDLNKNYNVFWELLLSSPQPQFVGFGKELCFGKTDANPEGIRQIQAGILDFADEYLKHFTKVPYMLNISGRDAYAPMIVAASGNEKYLKAIEKRFNFVIGVE